MQHLEEFTKSKIFVKLKTSSKKKNLLTVITKEKEELLDVFTLDDTKDHRPTSYKVPKHIHDSCVAMIADRRVLEAAMAEAEEAAGKMKD